ncbi:coiled-coil domain-containing protein [Kineosporia succinea]|uniref:Chromosome segregation ATPase n=1 Tax=Kineosporia succinea TaxID=84632 RepID=A0ABT9NXK0_9ACTN|nr:hypothetical protein [Kineosporia succinea]MDP9825141.1 chromosome segregation ATPase [Kineosporia succinea]
MSPTLDEAAGELYAVEPGRFTAERTRLARAARDDADSETAKAIGELRRPTTSAWLVNQLVRSDADEVTHLDQLGHDLREAQAALDATRMRDLTKQRQQLVAVLVRQADEIAAGAETKISTAVRRELEDTLGAAVADEQAAQAVFSGRLTRALTYAGFGEVDITEATATPLGASRPTMRRGDTKLADAKHSTEKHSTEKHSTTKHVSRPSKNTTSKQSHEPAEKTDQQAARRTQAEAQVQTARTELESAEESLRQKEQELDEATSEHDELQTRLNHLQAEVVSLRRQLDTGERRIAHAERDRKREERQLKDATRALERAEAALDRLEKP